MPSLLSCSVKHTAFVSSNANTENVNQSFHSKPFQFQKTTCHGCETFPSLLTHFSILPFYILFTHQQMHFLLNLEKFKIYIKIHINIAPTCSGFDHPQGACTEPGWSYISIKTLSEITLFYIMWRCGSMSVIQWGVFFNNKSAFVGEWTVYRFHNAQRNDKSYSTIHLTWLMFSSCKWYDTSGVNFLLYWTDSLERIRITRVRLSLPFLHISAFYNSFSTSDVQFL